MQKFQIKGDPKNPERFSSKIIIDSLNNGARKAGIHSENDKLIVYDCIANQHNLNPDAIICCYEFTIPYFVKYNSQNKPLIAVSRDNMIFLLESGYPKSKIGYINLGVDSEKFSKVEKKYYKDKFVCLSMTESLVRSGLEILIDGFGNAFSGNKEALLYVKDRNATLEFEKWIRNRAKYYNIELLYENNHLNTIEKILNMYSHADVHYYLNRSTTWGMNVLESISCGIPTASPMYSGPREYISDKLSGIGIEFELEDITQNKLIELQSIGMRNFFFPINQENYPRQPYWCKPKVESVSKTLLELYKNKELRKTLSFNGRAMAEQFTWERSAMNLSYTLGKLLT